MTTSRSAIDASRLRVTLVHERFTEYAGSEKVVAALAQRWPDAAVMAPIVLPAALPAALQGRVTGGALNRLVRSGGSYAHLLPLLPIAMRRLPVGRPDVVVASHHAFASQVVYATDAPVVAYVHTPARWIWDPSTRAGEAGGTAGAAALAAFSAAYRPFDVRAAGRLRMIVANSSAVAERIKRDWGQSARVVHPPVDTEYYTPDPSVEREDFFLIAGRLVPYKQPQLAIAAAKLAGVRLVVAGDGRSRAECEQLAGPNTTFLGRIDDEAQRDLFRRCAALIMPGVEDFGIVPVEAAACGAPVIATASGGALDTVIPGETGTLVSDTDDEHRWEAWASVLKSFRTSDFDPLAVRRHAEQFSRVSFITAMSAVVTEAASPREGDIHP